MVDFAERTLTAYRPVVPNRRRALFVSANDALREKLIDEAVRLHLSAKAIRLSGELPDMLRMYKFDWVILDLETDKEARLAMFRALSRQSAQAGIVLVSQDETVLASERTNAAAKGLKVVGVLSRAFPSSALGIALGRRARGRKVRPLRGRMRSSTGAGRSRPTRSCSTISPSSASKTAASGASKHSCASATRGMAC